MSMYGAVPTELREFGLRFVAQQESVAAIEHAVFAALSSTTWVGPARASSATTGTAASTRTWRHSSRRSRLPVPRPCPGPTR